VAKIVPASLHVVAGNKKRDVQGRAEGIALAFPRPWVGGGSAALVSGHGDELSVGVYMDPQGIVNPALSLLPGLALDDLNGAGGFPPADEVLGPPPGMKGGIKEFCSGIGLT
jgi:hypothetical protein